MNDVIILGFFLSILFLTVAFFRLLEKLKDTK
ncbi:hypothetical protein LTAR_02947 [Leptolinea tardivitalis]|nr:hypothetical protein LTAR_02947 [Leptolinea tardivitalis]